VTDALENSSDILLFNVVCRNNLKQLDEITVGLKRRLLGRHGAEDGHDSESAVPLSTSSAFVTAGSMVPNGTGTLELQSALHSSDHAISHTLASIGDSVTMGDAVTELMRRTLKSSGSHSTCHNLPDEHICASVDDEEDTDERNLPRDCTADPTDFLPLYDHEAEEQNSKNQASTSVGYNSDPLKTAQKLLEQLNDITAFNSQPVASNDQVDYASVADFDDCGTQEDDTLANIWALRQSTRRDDDDGDNESYLDSTVLSEERDKSYVLPQALNDVASNHEDFSAPTCNTYDFSGCGDTGDLPVLEHEGKQQLAVGCSGESSDTWFFDTQDVRNIDNLVVGQRLQEDVVSEPLDADNAAGVGQDPFVDTQAPGRPLSQSSPSIPAQLSPAISTTSHRTQKFRSLRRTAAQRREQMYVGNSTDSESDDLMASVRLRHQRPQCPPHDELPQNNANTEGSVNGAPTNVVKDEVNSMVDQRQETETVTNQEAEDSTKNEPDSANSNVVTVQSANMASPAKINGVTVSDGHALNCHRCPSGRDMYPLQQLMTYFLLVLKMHFINSCHLF